ncbi:MAG: UvrD-helicase domain-containing protein, partial [Eggerthellaceae bacterium]|nr:UvrD-helicase domain-containing protein [Eggerthellaceae bacterium]
MALTLGQQRCVDTLDRPLVVAAGAGSGKTFTLTQRIAGALESGYVSAIDEVCAITFTNKAAAELKSRIKAELRSRGLVEQALRVDEAWVSTIHGMCARILRAHALELGIDPAFRVAEGAEVTGYLDQAIDAVLAAEQETASSPKVDALFAEYAPRSFGGFGVSVESMLAELVTAASAQANGVDSFVMPGISLLPAVAVEQAIDSVESLAVAAEGEKESPKRDEWLVATGQALQDARDALASGIGDYGQALRLLSAFKLAKTFGSKDYKARVDEARGALAASTMEVRLGAARGHLETLVELARRVLDEFSALKRADGVLDNNDLLVLTARAIEEHPRIAAQYTDKFKLVMVDEFQDTDQMQVDMIKRLAGEDARSLCVVGDAQQSIYRFRGADVSVYRRHLQSVRSDWPDSVIELSDNFRSHGDVLAFVDRVFEKPAMFGGEFMSLSAGRDEAKVSAPFSDAEPRIVVQHTTRPWRGVDSQHAVRVAAARIADQFASLAAKGHAPG